MGQLSLTQEYSIDACAILDFWRPKSPPYDVKVRKFRSLWDYISKKIEDSTIVLPKMVADEVKTQNKELSEWIKAHKKFFVGYGDCVDKLSQIVNKYDIYTKSGKASFPDAILVAVSMGRNLTVITSERYVSTHSLVNPQIPNICEEFSVKWMNLPGFFEAERL